MCPSVILSVEIQEKVIGNRDWGNRGERNREGRLVGRLRGFEESRIESRRGF